MQPALTHMALHVKNLDANISFYKRFAGMSKVRYWQDEATGMRTAWLRCTKPGEAFVLVLLEGNPKQFTNANPQSPIGPLSHLGFALESREAVDKIAGLGEEEG